MYYAKRLLELHETKANIMTAMVAKAKDLPEYGIYQSIPGFSDKTVVSLIAELGAQKSINWTIFIQLIRQHLRYDCDYKN